MIPSVTVLVAFSAVVMTELSNLFAPALPTSRLLATVCNEAIAAESAPKVS
ncbi:MAG: hypothetical protein HQL78_01160 [Magnetococcales bacterium]|nr:hypothetical protein [Magnetococcales bacterium]